MSKEEARKELSELVPVQNKLIKQIEEQGLTEYCFVGKDDNKLLQQYRKTHDRANELAKILFS